MIIRIQKATKKDKRIISELYYQFHSVEERKNKEKGLLVPIEKSKIKPIFLIAKENKQVVGFIWAHLIEYGFFKYGTISEFYVKKEFRRKGIGSSLLKKAIEELEKLNPKIILVGTEKRNKEAIKLYQKLGFELGKKSSWFYWNPKKKSLK